jgi:SAM-dependent methyltransferase
MTDPQRAADLARWYDLDLRDDPGDAEMYRALLGRPDGAVLELAAGSGRLALPLALAGHRVVALDHDPAMLARADAAWAARRGRRPADRLRCVEADLVTARLGERYPLVFIGLNSLLLLDRAAQVACFHTLAAHLAPGGLAVIDVLLPDADDLALYDGRLLLEWVRTDPETGEQVTKLASARHDAATATVELVQIFEATPPHGGPVRRRLRQDRLHLVSARELELLAAAAGMAVEGVMGDYQLAPLEPGAERVILLARLVE